MIIYRNTKQAFISDVRSSSIVDELTESFRRIQGSRPAESEVRAWSNSLQFVANALDENELPSDAGVAVEYRIPATAKRVDVLLSGYDGSRRPNLVVVELKQWSKSTATSKDGILLANRFGGSETEGVHPSYQAWSYAELLRGFNAAIEKESIEINPCAYLHNHAADPLRQSILNPCYDEYLKASPVFLKGPAEQKRLQRFIEAHIRFGDGSRLIEEVEKGEIRPTKELADAVCSMMEGNAEFTLIDEQKLVYESVLALALAQPKPDEKHVVLVHGGPGTGKSVVAVNLLAELVSRHRLNACYVTKNAAPRQVYSQKLIDFGAARRKDKKGALKALAKGLFKSSDWAWEAKENAYRCLLIDEAHRLRQKSGLYQNLGENQIRELIHAAEVSVFFIDDAQQVTTKDFGSSQNILTEATDAGAVIHEFSLPSQFRCGGSDGYIAWIDHTLGIRETANQTLDGIPYDFRVFDRAADMRDALLERQSRGLPARIVAGYCWKWNSSKPGAQPEHRDIELDGGTFAFDWNLKDDGGLWLVRDEGLERVGCIHTCQGLEVPYVGVIIGPDLVIRNGMPVTDYRQRASSDKSLQGIKTLAKTNSEEAQKIADRIIKNTYRVLMTRGTKGCFVYSPDEETREWLRRKAGVR